MTKEKSVINWIPNSLENIDARTFSSYKATAKNPAMTKETSAVNARLISNLKEFFLLSIREKDRYFIFYLL